MRFTILFSILSLLIMVACNKDDTPTDDRTEEQMIADFIADNNLKGEFKEDGIFISIDDPQLGERPNANSTVSALYEGRYAADGKIFDSSLIDPISFSLQRVVPGWTKGIPYFGKGDKGWLIFPSSLGYGSFPPNGFRSNAPLAFYIELVDIIK